MSLISIVGISIIDAKSALRAAINPKYGNRIIYNNNINLDGEAAE